MSCLTCFQQPVSFAIRQTRPQGPCTYRDENLIGGERGLIPISGKAANEPTPSSDITSQQPESVKCKNHFYSSDLVLWMQLFDPSSISIPSGGIASESILMGR
jgi:hypothetical protein